MLQRFLLDETHSPLMPTFLQASSSIFYQNNNTCKGKQIHFLICQSCFWCASRLNNIGEDTITTKCPSCSNNRVESIPISYNEVYKFDFDPKRGVTLEFLKVDEEEVVLN